MTKKSFEEFLKRQQPTPSEQVVDWGRRRDDWLQHLGEFYRLVKGFLDPYIAAHQLEYTESEKPLREDYIGEYQARQARIRIGRNDLMLDPIGTTLLGARGRVDLVGPAGRKRFVLVDASSTAPKVVVRTGFAGQLPHPEEPAEVPVAWAWKIATDPPRINYLPLTQESFLDALRDVSNG